jgi:signal transduction histidine kinase
MAEIRRAGVSSSARPALVRTASHSGFSSFAECLSTRERDSRLFTTIQPTSNVARHAHATLLTIAVQFTDSTLHLTIIDDGIGLAELPQTTGRATGLTRLGLRIMRYRAERIGGAFQIDRRTPHGTAIRVSCPSSILAAR